MAGGTSTLARIAAPAAFLLAATILVLLVRSALDAGEPAASNEPAATATATGAATTATEPATTQPARTTTVARPRPRPRPRPAATQPQATYHEIQSGDTLESIATQYGTTVQALMELNPGVDPRGLTVGERLRVG